MPTYEIDFPARITYQVEADTVEEAIAASHKIIGEGFPLGGPFKTLTINSSPMNAEVFSFGCWVKCDLPKECD